MDILYYLIPLSVLLLLVIVTALVWAIKSGQFDDLDRMGYQILFDEEPATKPNDKPNQQKDLEWRT